MALPYDILTKIFSYIPPSINTCLVCKGVQKSRKPITFLTNELIFNPPLWLLSELKYLVAVQGSYNALEFCIWTCYQQSWTEAAEQFISVAREQGNEDLMNRINVYRTRIIDTSIPNSDICIRNGNIAAYLMLPREYHDFDIFDIALHHQCMLFTTYMMLHSGIIMNEEMLENFIKDAQVDVELIKWAIRNFGLIDSELIMTTLASVGKLEGFRYFHLQYNYPITDNVIKCAKANKQEALIEYIHSVNK